MRKMSLGMKYACPLATVSYGVLYLNAMTTFLLKLFISLYNQ